MTAARRRAWVQVLDELEERLTRASETLAGGEVHPASAWSAPSADLGPLPEPLAARARELLTRQQSVADDIGRLLSATRQQQRVTDRVRHATQSPAPSIYLDVTA